MKSPSENTIHRIVENNTFGITSVVDFESIKSIYLNRQSYHWLASLIRAKGARSPTLREYLEVIQFESQNGWKFIAIVYDSDELWQDP